ncbi:hypothetical protein FB446DRAFT_710116, partial [Lentinula raphanica]
QQREKIKRCYQNDRPVAKYVYELENLMNLVGAMGKRDKIVSEAELIELADLDNELGICTKNKPQSNKPNDGGKNSFKNEQKSKNLFQKNGKWRNKSSNFQSQGSGQASSSSQPFSGKSNHKSNYSNNNNRSNKKSFDGKKTPRLSDAKRAQYDAEGSGNGPPGLAARGMHFPETQDTALEELNETTETGVELVLNMMSFDSFTSDLAETPTFEFLSDSGSPFEDFTNGLFTIAEDEIEDDDDDDMPSLIAVSDSELDDDDRYQDWDDWDDDESVNDSETHVDEDDNHHDHFLDHDDDDDLGPAGMAVPSPVSSSDTDNEADDEQSPRDDEFEGLPELQEVPDSDLEPDESDSDTVSELALDGKDHGSVPEGENEVDIESFGPFIPMNEEYLAQLNGDLE